MAAVLVVDDAADVRLLLRTVLTEGGFHVTEAAGGAEAIALLEGVLPDLVLLDVQMPGNDGWQTLTAIRARRRTSTLPVVICTVKGGADDRARGYRLGCDGYLVKPFSINDVVDVVAEVLARSPNERVAVRQRRSAQSVDSEVKP